jgi:hypothetical protein
MEESERERERESREYINTYIYREIIYFSMFKEKCIMLMIVFFNKVALCSNLMVNLFCLFFKLSIFIVIFNYLLL